MTESTRGSSRRRRRSPRPAPDAAPAPSSMALPPPPPAVDDAKARRRPRDAEGGMRELVGGGKSQLGVSRALRGRDVNRPSEADLEAAERDVVIVRRHWSPPPSG